MMMRGDLHQIMADEYIGIQNQILITVKMNTPNNSYMERAIEKASKLIDLLSKQNEQLKSDNLSLNEKLELAQKQSSAQVTANAQLRQQLITYQQLQGSLNHAASTIANLTAKVEEKTKRNKQLHEKLSDLTIKMQELGKSAEKERKKNLALQNQNQYLIKTYCQQEMKENEFQNYCERVEANFMKEMSLLDRTKMAFSRKCEELKMQNGQLRKEIATLKQENEECRKKDLYLSENVVKLGEMERQIKRTNDALSYIIESTLKIKAESGLYLKVEQIKNYIGYRLQHIENLIKPIIDILKTDPDSGFIVTEIKNLEELSAMASRFSVYLSELTK